MGSRNIVLTELLFHTCVEPQLMALCGPCVLRFVRPLWLTVEHFGAALKPLVSKIKL